mmetsp:Transcript_24594/g.21827  ORF Transcript_24594/g.21827 Transcript_24594/m.21827 type:complete len:175 (-) Transcript_24594:25-549(-)
MDPESNCEVKEFETKRINKFFNLTNETWIEDLDQWHIETIYVVQNMSLYYTFMMIQQILKEKKENQNDFKYTIEEWKYDEIIESKYNFEEILDTENHLKFIQLLDSSYLIKSNVEAYKDEDRKEKKLNKISKYNLRSTLIVEKIILITNINKGEENEIKTILCACPKYFINYKD